MKVNSLSQRSLFSLVSALREVADRLVSVCGGNPLCLSGQAQGTYPDKKERVILRLGVINISVINVPKFMRKACYNRHPRGVAQPG